MLLVPPIAALVSLWGFAAATTLGDSLRQTRGQTFDEKVIKPTDAMIAALQDERRMSLSYLGDDSTIGRSGFDAQRAQTDRARTAFRAAAAERGVRGATRPQTRRRMIRLASDLGELDDARRSVDRRLIDRDQALSRYTAFIDSAAEIYDEVRSGDERIVRDTRLLIELERARENLAREDALVTGALAAGTMTADEHLRLVRFAGARDFLYEDASRSLSEPDRTRYEKIVSGPEYTTFQQLEQRLTRSGDSARPPVDVGAWHTSTESLNAQLAGFSSAIRADTADSAAKEGDAVLLRLSLAGGLGLLAVVIAIVVAVRMARRLIRESRDVAHTVARFTRDRLPEISERARRGELMPGADGELVEVADGAGTGPDDTGFVLAGAGPHTGFTVTEIDKIDEAFTEARRAVIRASVGEAAAHKRLNDVFVTLARRNQSLLQRLLRMLEGMQRDTEDPDDLAALFELDHLATRMRRHAEGLVILSGRPSGRSWRRPVRMVDVARAAASEVEDYTRVEVVPMGRTALTGRAVADTIHLLAELIENAAAFSPPNTRIRVTGDEVAHGFAVEIEDRGLGLSREDMERLNDRLGTDPEFDLDDSAQLGLFVVARLAARHGVKVSLRSSPYGGVIAIVLVPHELITDSAAADTATTETTEPRKPLVAVSSGAPSEPRRPRYATSASPPATPALLAGAPETIGSSAPAPAPASDPGSSDGAASDGAAADAGASDGEATRLRAADPGAADAGAVGSGAEVSENSATSAFDPGAAREEPAGEETAAPAGTVIFSAAALGATNPGTSGPSTSAPGMFGSGPVDSGASGETVAGLPKRRRQENLVPQLRDAPAEPADDVPERSPEAARRLLSRMQSGWRRGRSDADPGPIPEPPPGPGGE